MSVYFLPPLLAGPGDVPRKAQGTEAWKYVLFHSTVHQLRVIWLSQQTIFIKYFKDKSSKDFSGVFYSQCEWSVHFIACGYSGRPYYGHGDTWRWFTPLFGPDLSLPIQRLKEGFHNMDPCLPLPWKCTVLCYPPPPASLPPCLTSSLCQRYKRCLQSVTAWDLLG